jgi:hypothetical protein
MWLVCLEEDATISFPCDSDVSTMWMSPIRDIEIELQINKEDKREREKKKET